MMCRRSEVGGVWPAILFSLAVATILGLFAAPIIHCHTGRAEVSRTSIGKVLSVDYRPGGFGSPSATIVQTERATVIVRDWSLSVMKGVEAWFVRDERGRKWFTWAGSTRRWLVGG